MKKHLQNLHQNHFFLMDVRLSLVQMIGKAKDGSKTEDKEKELVLKQKLCVELMEVINVISPGELNVPYFIPPFHKYCNCASSSLSQAFLVFAPLFCTNFSLPCPNTRGRSISVERSHRRT